MTQSSMADTPQGAIGAFREVCDQFLELSRSGQSNSVPIWGGTWSHAKYLLRHPIRGHVRMLRDGHRAQSGVGALAPFFPLQSMVDYLSRYSEPQLKAIKSLSEVNLRRVKSMITDNPMFKAAVPIGSAYALLQASNKLVTARDSSLDLVREIMASPITQAFMGSLFVVLMFILVLFAAQYIFFVIPTIARAQLLDDVLLVALEEKRFTSSSASSPNSSLQTDAAQADGR
jgi:hypothetical protein